jgi:hypothetical protein
MHQFLWPSFLPRARRASAVSALVLAVAAFAAPAEELPPALRLASALIAQRASEAQAAGRQAVANTLRELAEAVAARQVGLGEAALLVEIAGGAPVAPLVASGSARRAAAAEPKLSQAQAVDIVEGAGLAAVAPPVAPLLTGAVLVVARGKDGKSQLVAIGLGKDKGVNVGQRFLVRRDGKRLAELVIGDASDATMSTGFIVPGTEAEPNVEILKGDEVVFPIPP